MTLPGLLLHGAASLVLVVWGVYALADQSDELAYRRFTRKVGVQRHIVVDVVRHFTGPVLGLLVVVLAVWL